MDGLIDILARYRWFHLVGSGLLFTLALSWLFVSERRKYSAWLDPSFPLSTRLTARLGLLCSWLIPFCILGVWVAFLTVATMDKGVLQDWVSSLQR